MKRTQKYLLNAILKNAKSISIRDAQFYLHDLHPVYCPHLCGCYDNLSAVRSSGLRYLYNELVSPTEIS